MRELLGVLRSDGHDTAPRPTLAQLEALLGAPRRTRSRVEGRRRALPAGVELAAYRTIELALEAFGGACDGPVGVRLRYLATALELEVDGPLPARASAGALDAARERVTGARRQLRRGAGAGRPHARARPAAARFADA